MLDNNLFGWQSGGTESKAVPGLCIMQEEGRKNEHRLLIQVQVRNWKVTIKE